MSNKADYTALAGRTQGYALQVKRLFDEAVKELLDIAKAAKTGQMFNFDQSKTMADRAQRALRRLHAAVTTAIERGIQLEWGRADKAADELVASVFGKQALKDKRYSTMLVRNDKALGAFMRRADNGMNLSKRVWQSCESLQKEMELAISVSVGEGVSADTMSRRVRQYLNEPNKLFRRVRKGTDADGNPIYGLSKAAAAYHPGRGVYRSSYKNAMRLARTETNMAYRTEDCSRMSKLDFVLGIRINLSKNHPEKDICDELAGDYPKTFKFTGWHPQCRCYMTSILPSAEELKAYNKALLNGENYTFKGRVTAFPAAFKDWVRDNAEKIENGSSVPYFVSENQNAIDSILGKEQTGVISAAPTPFQYEKIKDPNITYNDHMFNGAPVKERLDNLMNGIDGVFGDVGAVKLIRSMNNADPAIAKRNWDWLKNYRTPECKAMYASISHLNELRTADLSQVPQQWQTTLNELIKKINAHDMTKGCFDIYPEIEHAYNIYKLSTTKEAVAFGLENLSDKTPCELFTVLQKKFSGLPIPPKEFFDTLDRYVPLVTKTTKTEYNRVYRMVSISAMYKDNVLRLSTSKWYQTGLVFHEYGHALDHQKDLRNDKALVKIFDDWKAELRLDDGAAIKAEVKRILDAERQKFEDWWKTSDENQRSYKAVNDAIAAKDWDAWQKATDARHELYMRLRAEHMYDLEEQLGALTDCLQAALAKHDFIQPRGHQPKYFAAKDQQLAEFIAHCSENYWNGNQYFKQLAPTLYSLMSSYFGGI